MFGQYKKENIRLKKELDETRILLSTSTAFLDDKNKHIAELQDEVVYAKRAAEKEGARALDLRRQLDVAVEHVEHLQRDYEAARTKRDEAEASAAKNEQAVQTARREILRLHNENTEHEKVIQSLRASNAELEGLLAAAQGWQDGMAEDLEEAREAAQGYKEQMEAFHSNLVQVIKEREAKSAHIRELEAELAALRKQYAGMKEQRDELTKLLDDNGRDYTESMDAMGEKIKVLIAERDSALTACKSAQDHEAQREAYHKTRFETACGRADGFKAEACQLRGRLTEKDAEIAALTAELTQTRAELKTSRIELSSIGNEATTLIDRVSSMIAEAVGANPPEVKKSVTVEDLDHTRQAADMAGELYTYLLRMAQGQL